MTKRNATIISTIMLLVIFTLPGFAQLPALEAPEASPAAITNQRIGLTDITVTYHRPAVKERVVWGKLVPYNEVWRAGANENTVISFSTPVKINGTSLPAGSYGIHMIPTENEWTVIISSNYWSWGSFFYKQDEDKLRFTLSPQESDYQEWLQYTFENLSPSSCELVLRWEKLKVPIKIEIDLPETVLASYLNELDGVDGFFWQGWNQAANFALQNNTRIDDAMIWVDRSLGIQKNFNNLSTKSKILEKMGKSEEAQKLNEEALVAATEADINTLGYQYIASNKIDEAIKLFQKNIEDHPKSWNAYDSLGEALALKGEKDEAIKNYEIALSMVEDQTQKTRITKILAGLK